MPKKHTPSNKTRKRTGKDLDQIYEDLIPAKCAKLQSQPIDLDLPGNGQYYCVECSRYFLDEKTILKHKSTKVHKRRLKALQEPVYTQEDAEISAGLGV